MDENNNIWFDLLTLNIYVEDIRAKLHKRKIKYLHLKTIDNFLFHFHHLDDEKQQVVYNVLYNYLITRKEAEDLDQIDAKLGKALFEDQVLPVAKIYDKNVNFVPYAKTDVLFIWLIIISGLMFAFGGPMYLYLVICVFFLVHYFRLFKKRKDKKVYGYFY